MKIKKYFMLMAIAMVALSFGLATASAVSEAISEKKNNGIVIESKDKTVSYKVTWNANGGKIGTVKTTVTSVKSGSKIGKLSVPKRTGYSFKGWYSAKSGGTKISTNTKPTKSVTFFAQWKKGSINTNSNIDSKLIGRWNWEVAGDRYLFIFTKMEV